jgi:hypothetical protein
VSIRNGTSRSASRCSWRTSGESRWRSGCSPTTSRASSLFVGSCSTTAWSGWQSSGPDALLVERLLDAGLCLLALHSNQVKAARASFRAQGGKSDLFDVLVLCELARTDARSPTSTRDRARLPRALPPRRATPAERSRSRGSRRSPRPAPCRSGAGPRGCRRRASRRPGPTARPARDRPLPRRRSPGDAAAERRRVSRLSRSLVAAPWTTSSSACRRSLRCSSRQKRTCSPSTPSPKSTTASCAARTRSSASTARSVGAPTSSASSPTTGR